MHDAYHATTSHVAFIRPVSRALRSYRDGNPMDPKVKANWVSVYNQFRVNRKMSTIRRTGGLLTHRLVENMSAAEVKAFTENQELQVHNMYNPGVCQPPANYRRQLQDVAEDPSVANEDFQVESEEEMESADRRKSFQHRLRTSPLLTYHHLHVLYIHN